MITQFHDTELDAGYAPIVAVPREWRGARLLVAVGLALVVLAVLRWTVFRDPAGAAGQVLAGLTMLSVFIRSGMIPPRTPALAVFKDGIKLPSGRLAPGRESWEPWSYGFYSWGEVSYCRWSPYRVGRLSIYLNATKYQSELFGPSDGSGLNAPPTLFFHDVPEPYRVAVEAAIRAAGKWAV